MGHENEHVALDPPRFELRQEIHAEHVERPEAWRADDLEVAGDDVPNPELVDRARARCRDTVGRVQHDGREAGPGIDMGGAGGVFRNRSDGRPAIDEHPPVDAIDRGDHPEMAIWRHMNAQLFPRDRLIVEAEAARQARQFGLVGRLLKQNEDQEREQAEGDREAEDAPDHRNALHHHDDESGRERIQGEMLPLR